jgi:hypothetical protein
MLLKTNGIFLKFQRRIAISSKMEEMITVFNFSLFHQNLIKPILVRKGWNQQKMARDIDFRALGGRESLWTTGEKTGFSRVHC